MNRRVSIRFGIVFLVAQIAATAAFAQATRTWVSGVGDDANPCSRTAPCKTFAGAISKTAAAGEIDVLDPGGFGAVTITKSITIDGSGGSIAGIAASLTNGIIVSAGVNDVVTLRNLDINGMGNGIDGIRLNSAKALHIENCLTQGFQKGIEVLTTTPNTAVSIRNSISRNNSNAGLLVNPTGSGTVALAIEDSHFDGNNFSGIDLVDFTKGTITRSTLIGNQTVGLQAQASSVEVALTQVTVSGNNFGINAGAVSAAIVRLSLSMVSENTNGITFANGAQVISHTNNAIAGNGAGTNAPSSAIGAQ